MYKVFVNQGWLFPGMEVPADQRDGLMHIGLNSSREELVSLVDKMLEHTGDIHVQLGHPGEEEEAWNYLKECFTEQSAFGGYVLNPRKELLMIRRKGLWDIPKGKPDPGETAEETALREVEEETRIRPDKVWGFHGESYHIFKRNGQTYLKRNVWYRMSTLDQGEPIPQVEESITEAKWVSFKTYQEIRTEMYPSLLELTDHFWDLIMDIQK